MKNIIILLIAITTSFAGFAQKAKANAKANKGTTIISTYSCPMHQDITSDKPGKCSKCGMDLSLSKKEIMKREVVKLYTCPMHPDVVTEKDGTCPKCGMKLTEKKQAEDSKNNN